MPDEAGCQCQMPPAAAKEQKQAGAMEMRFYEEVKKINSHAGTRTRVYWVKANYPNHLDYMGR